MTRWRWLRRWRPEPEVVIEASYGWCWIVDVLQEQGATVHREPVGLADAYATRARSQRTLIDTYDGEVVILETQIRSRLRGHRGYRAIQAITGIGPTMAAILVAEIGDATRVRSAPALWSWAGFTPKHKASDTAARWRHQTRIPARAVGGHRGRYHIGGKLAADYR